VQGIDRVLFRFERSYEEEEEEEKEEKFRREPCPW
jgi:hypothetical protein